MTQPNRQPAPFPSPADLRPLGIDGPLRFARAWAASSVGEHDPQPVQAVCRRQGWGELQVGRSIVRRTLRINGREFSHGLGTHADSEILLRAGQPVRSLRAWVGLDDNEATRNRNPGLLPRLVFRVSAGGRELWHSPALGAGAPALLVEVETGGAEELLLEVRSVDGGIDAAHADWAGLELELADGTRARVEHHGIPGQALPAGRVPFSFRYGGRDAGGLLPGWEVTRTTKPGPEGVGVRVFSWRDPASGLVCELEQQVFADYPAVEWLLRLRNTGTADTPLLEDIRPLDILWNADGDAWLRRSRGSPCRPEDFEYLVEPLPPGAEVRMAAGGGRSSNDWLPFFNLQTGAGGVISAVGWTGQWAAGFDHEAGGRIRLRAGQELTRLVLHPGEEIRTPRILLLFWTGDPLDGHNLLRRFILAHHTPRPDGELLRAPLTMGHWGGLKSAGHLERIAAYGRQRLGYDYYWVDAGWYGPPDSYSPDEFTGDWFKHVGDWGINPVAHPAGLRPISDAAAAAGMKFLLWFEPERAVTGTPLALEHPDWFLGERKSGGSLLLDLGNPAALRWLTDHVAGFMATHGVHLYRQDFNFDPLPYWRAADAPDRQGMAEIRHIEGLYAFWDELLRRQPGLVIDNCASGGRRIDLETISRSIPLWRSDWQCGWVNEPTPGQTHTMGLSYWVPLSGTGVLGCCRRAGDTYNFRSSLSAAISFAIFPYESFPIQDDYPWDWHKRMLADFRRARPLFYGDYHPLTACTTDQRGWAMFQMHRQDLGEGMLLAFRRPDAPYLNAEVRLQAVDPAARYELDDADSGRTWRQTGAELLKRGLVLEMSAAPESRLVFYRRLGAGEP